MATRKAEPRKRWQFLWCAEESPPRNGDSHAWKTKVFRAATFEKAMDLMLAFIQAKRFVCLVDYECRAEHVPYRGQENHSAAFPRIDHTGHELAEHLG